MVVPDEPDDRTLREVDSRADADRLAGGGSDSAAGVNKARALSALAAAGRGALSAGRWFGLRARDTYLAVDPDLRRTLAELPLVGATSIGSREVIIEELPDDGHNPCLFVHGLSGHPRNFLPAKLFFRSQGRRRGYLFGYRDNHPFVDSARALAEAIVRVAVVNTLPEGRGVDVVAHSMGGLLTRLALMDPEVAKRVGTVVTLGTPHHGTYAARFLATERALDLRPESPLLKTLEAQVPWPGPPTLPRLVTYWSRADVLMLPSDTARVEGAEHVELQGISHTGYLLRPSVLFHVLGVLSGSE